LTSPRHFLRRTCCIADNAVPLVAGGCNSEAVVVTDLPQSPPTYYEEASWVGSGGEPSSAGSFDGAPTFDTSPWAHSRQFFVVPKDGSCVIKTAASEIRAYCVLGGEFQRG
jgi:hypothetical protein